MMVIVALDEKYNASKIPDESRAVPPLKKSSMIVLIILKVALSGVMVLTMINTSSYRVSDSGKLDNNVNIKIKKGGTAIRKLNAIDAARSFKPISCVCFIKK
jgi:hypothetical protein